MLGGDITVDSTPGKGSTFSVTVETGPLRRCRHARRESDSEAAAARDREMSHAGRAAVRLDCRILLAEDGPDNQRLISFILEKAGAEVTVAENGQIAFDEALAARGTGRIRST